MPMYKKMLVSNGRRFYKKITSAAIIKRKLNIDLLEAPARFYEEANRRFNKTLLKIVLFVCLAVLLKMWTLFVLSVVYSFFISFFSFEMLALEEEKKAEKKFLVHEKEIAEKYKIKHDLAKAFDANFWYRKGIRYIPYRNTIKIIKSFRKQLERKQNDV